MLEPSAFDYAIVRVVPNVRRGEFLNVGVIVFCRTKRFLAARIEFDPARLQCLDTLCDPADVQTHLDSIVRVCMGGSEAGTIGLLSQSERFHWLVAPRSTIIQTSPVHPGLCVDPVPELEKLMDRMVRRKPN